MAAAGSVTIEARYDGTAGFVYAGGGRCFWTIEVEGRTATLRPNNTNTTIPATLKAACDVALRDYLAAWGSRRERGLE